MRNPAGGTAAGFAAVLLLTAAAYAPVLGGGYVWDDGLYLASNASIRAPGGLLRIWTDPAASPNPYPLVFTTYWIEYRLWGLHPAGYHAVNILLHLLNGLLLRRLLVRLGFRGAGAAAAIFLLHPVNAQSVAWITERKNTLAMAFTLLALLAWVRALDTGGRRWLAASGGAFLLALLAKTAVCPLPVLLGGLAVRRKPQRRGEALAAAAGMLALAGFFALQTARWEVKLSGGADSAAQLGAGGHLAAAARAGWWYPGRLLWPFALTPAPPRWEIPGADAGRFLFHAGWGAAFALTLALRRRASFAAAGSLLFFYILLAPALGLVKHSSMPLYFVSNHWVYFSMAGAAAAAGSAFEGLARRAPRPWRIAAGGFAALALAAGTAFQAFSFRNGESLWGRAAGIHPAPWALNNLGLALGERGRWDLAESEFRKALDADPDFGQAIANLGHALVNQGRAAEAEPWLRRAAGAGADGAAALLNLGVAAERQGRLDEAARRFREVLEKNPEHLGALANLGALEARLGRPAEGEALLRKALEIDPDHADALINLGAVLEAAGRPADALAAYDRAARVRPRDPAVALRRGNALAALGRTPEALAEYERAAGLAPASAEIRLNLGALLAETGREAEALPHLTEAVRLDPASAAARFNLGVALLNLGRPEEARSRLREALEIDSGFAPAAEALKTMGEAN